MKIEIDFSDDNARMLMHDELVDEFGENVVEQLLQNAVRQQITNLYDNREKLRQELQ